MTPADADAVLHEVARWVITQRRGTRAATLPLALAVRWDAHGAAAWAACTLDAAMRVLLGVVRRARERGAPAPSGFALSRIFCDRHAVPPLGAPPPIHRGPCPACCDAIRAAEPAPSLRALLAAPKVPA